MSTAVRLEVVQSYGRGIYLCDCTTGLLKTTIVLDKWGDVTSFKGFNPHGKLFGLEIPVAAK